MKFIYPVEIDSVVTAYSGAFVNMERVNDGAIDFAMTGIANTETIRFTLSATKSVDCVAIYVTSGTGTANIHKDFSPGSSIGSGSLSAGWNIITITEANGQYWNIVFSSVSSLTVAEIFPGQTFDFPYNYDLGNTDQSIFGVDVVTSEGGNEFTNKRHAEKFLKNWNWQSFSTTNKTAYKAMLTAIDGIRTKILWDSSTSGSAVYNWIRLPSVPVFTEETYGAYGLPGGAREQLI